MRGTLALVALIVGLAGASAAGAREPRGATTSADPAPAAAPATAGVPLKAESGALLVPVMINGAVQLDFTLDSGASVVSIPADVAMTLMRTGTITRDDFLGNETFQLADGSTVPSTILRIRSLKVGDLELQDVEASVSDVKGALLLGQTFLGRLSSWTVDNQRHVLVLGAEIPGSAQALALALTPPHRSHRRSHADDEASGAAPSAYAPAPAAAGDTGSSRAETSEQWDADFYQLCVTPQPGSATPPGSPAYCHCVGALLQPLPLSRKKRLRPHSHELEAAIAQCLQH